LVNPVAVAAEHERADGGGFFVRALWVYPVGAIGASRPVTQHAAGVDDADARYLRYVFARL
jgi:hypothetical protein